MQTFPFVHQIFHSSPFMKDFANDENWMDKLDTFMYSPNMKENHVSYKITHLARATSTPTPIPTPIPPNETTREERLPQNNPISVVLPPPPPPPPPINAVIRPPSTKSNNCNEYFEPPYTKDTIFWCVYQHVYGDREMERLGSGKLGNAMLEEQTKLMEHFKQHSKDLKHSNVKFTKDKMNEVISELMCNRGESSFMMIAAYAVYYKLQIYLLDETKHIYLKFVDNSQLLNDDDAPDGAQESTHICVLYKNPRSKSFGSKYYKKKISDKSELKILDTMCELVQYDKPLCGISTYSVANLEEMAKKLQLNISCVGEQEHEGEPVKKPKKINKTELYKKIAEKIAWTM